MKTYNTKKLSNCLDQWIGKLLAKLPDMITGRTDVMRQKYRMKYGRKDCSQLIFIKKKKILKQYLLVTLILLAALIYAGLGTLNDGKGIKMLERPDYGMANQMIPATAHINYQGHELERDVQIRLKSRGLNEQEKRNILNQYSAVLGTKILGNNEDPNHITKPLNLIERDNATGVTIQWSSDRPDLITEDGEIDFIKAGKGTKIRLDAVLTLDQATTEKSIVIKTSNKIASEDFDRNLILRLEEKISRLNENTVDPKIKLPAGLGNGIKVDWETQETGNPGLIIAAFLFLAAIVYFKRYDDVDKEIREAAGSITIDLPDFINKLVLLLNAGMVVSSALLKIADDYDSNRPASVIPGNQSGRRRYLYEELCEIRKQTVQSNASMIKELVEFAQRSGIREWIRLTTIISDNWDKGSALAEKLEAESGLLWNGRKKKAEERGRLAETKLTFPLVIQLIVLIMITIAPAMMEM